MSKKLQFALLVNTLWVSISIFGQEMVPFSDRISFPNIKGDLVMIGNDIVGVIKDKDGNLFTNPNRNYNGSDNNGNYVTAFIDVDGDPTTFSSSEAGLTVPEEGCSKLVYAGLYWSANYYMARVDSPNNFTDNDIPSNSDTNTALIINNGPLAQQYIVRNAEFDNDNADIQKSPVTSYLAVAQPENGCGITNGAQLSGNIAVIREGGSCSLREKAVNAQNSGAVGVVIVSDNGLLPRLTGNGAPITIPVVSIGNDDIDNANFTNGDLVTLLQAESNVVLATLSTDDGRGTLNDLPLIDPRKQGPADFRNVKFKVPGGVYNEVTATSVVFDGYRNTPTNPDDAAIDELPYVCYADVTSLLDPDNYFGTYTLADMNATQGFTSIGDGACGGWVLAVVYENPQETSKFISVNDGFTTIFPGQQPIGFTYNGFQTPEGNQPVGVRFGVASLEGDRGFVGDQLSLLNTNNVFIPLGDGGVNPDTNFFNSSISYDGSFIANRNPNSQNTQGFDIDLFELPNNNNILIGNDQDAVTFQLSAEGDRFGLFLNALSVSNMQLELSVINRVYDEQGGTEITGENVMLGDQLLYELEIQNTGNEDVVDGSVVITSELSTNTDFIEVVTSSLPPGVVFNQVTPGVLQFSIPSNLLEISNQDTAIFIRYKASVVADCSEIRDTCSNEIVNLVSFIYTGLVSGISASGSGVSGVDACGEDLENIPNTLVNVPACEMDIVSCTNELFLVAGGGYTRYTWSGPGIQTPVITTVNTFQVPNPQTGAYTVVKEDTDGIDPQCLTLTEIFNVQVFSDAVQNPILDYVNDINVISEDCNGMEIPQIVLCGDQSFLLETNFDPSSLVSISWQRLNPSGSCVLDPDDSCSLINGDCTDVNWIEVMDGNTPNYTVSESGDYRILAEFDSGCVAPFYFAVFKNDYQPELSSNPIVCGNEGSVRVLNAPVDFAFSLTSGGPYTNTSGTFDISTAGDITVYAIDTAFPGCEYSATINVPSFDPIVSVNSVDPLCAEELGRIEVTIVDGLPPFTYILDGNIEIGPATESTITFDNVSIGEHQIQVIDSNQCETFENVSINESDAIIEVSNTITPVICGGSVNSSELGAIDLTVSGGTGTYTYTLVEASNLLVSPLIPAITISPNPTVITSTEVRFEGLDFGQYYIFAENLNDIASCSRVFFGPYDVFSPPSDLIQNITVGPSCSEGIILDVEIQGGSGINPPANPPPGFDIRLVGEPAPDGVFQPLNDNPINATVVDAVTPIRTHQYTNLEFNRSYILEVRDLATGCIYQELIAPVAPPSEPNIINFVATDVSCNESPALDNGEISFDISGYAPTVTQVSWEIFDQITNITLGAAYAGNATAVSPTDIPVTISNFPPGQYYVIVREDNGTSCPARQDFVIDVPNSLNSVLTNITPANSCGDHAEVIIQTDGGTPFDIPLTADGYTYALTADGAGDPGVYPLNSNRIDLGNIAGDFDIWVADANGCTFGPLDVNTVVHPLPTALASFIDDCTYDTSNIIDVDGTGLGTLLYQLDGGTTVVGNIDNNNHQFIVSTSGTYTITVTDESGCSVNTIVTVYNELAINAAVTTVPTCGDADGVITATITSGAPQGTLSYELQNGTGIPTANMTGNATGVYTGVPSGDYIVVVTDDGRGRTSFCSFSTMVSIDSVIPIIADITITQDYSCNASGEITISNPTGGNGQYEYSLDATIWSINNQFTGLTEGNYNVYIRDSNTIACPVLLGSLTLDPLREVIDLDFIATAIVCDTSVTSISVVATGTNGANIFEYRISAPIVTPWQTANIFDNLEQGVIYTFEARTDDDCNYSEDYAIDTIAPLVVTGEIVSDIICNGDMNGIAKIEVSGGTPPYTFTSSLNPALFYSDNADGVIGEHTFTDIPAGSYEFLAQDSTGCSFSIPLTLVEPSELLVSVDTDETGTIIVNASGGTPVYAYQLLSADGITMLFPEQTSNTFDVDVSGEYVVKVLDVNGCEVLESITVTITNQNPILDYADEILFCALIGESYPVISIQDENGEEVDVSFTDAISIVWQRLDDISCNRPLDETCPTTDDSCSSDWFDFETGPDCTVLEPGEYRVVITFANRVAQSTEMYYFRAEGNTLDIIDNEKPNIHLYPNPANTTVNINRDISLIKVFDVSGKLVLQSIQNSFDISVLKNGVYFTEVETSTGTKTIIKLVKQ